MTRGPTVAVRLGAVGAAAVLAGSSLLVTVAVQVLGGPAFADTAPFEVFCSGSPIGNLVLNDAMASGTVSTSNPAAGSSFSLNGFQAQVTIPASVAQAAAAINATSLTGTLSATVDATGATPASTPLSESFSLAIPNPVPTSGVTVMTPSAPVNVGPFTATGNTVSLSLGSSLTLSVNLGVEQFALKCATYPNDVITPSGTTQQIPPGLPVSPLIAVSPPGSTPPTTTPPSGTTGPYELYCPHTPVGDLVFNDVVTTGTISSSNLSAGQSFSVNDYRTTIPVPPGVVSAVVGLGNNALNGIAAGAVDAYGAAPEQAATGSMAFDVPISSPPPSNALRVALPSSPTTIGPFIADGGPITIAADQSLQVVAALSGKAFTMACSAYPNDSVPTSGSTTVAPAGSPIRPVLDAAVASGTPSTTTTTFPTFPQRVTGPYELYCPRTPVGDIVLNDVNTTATIPTGLTQGDSFTLNGLQTQFSIPQAVAQQMENLGLTQVSGVLSMFVNTTGTSGFGPVNTPVPVGSGGGSGTVTATTVVGPITTTSPPPPVTSPGSGSVTTDTVPPSAPPTIVPTVPVTTPPVSTPGPIFFYGGLSMAFSDTLPNPVPTSGVQFTATPPAQQVGEQFVASGGPIQIMASSFNLNVNAFGDQFGLFCTPFPNESEPTGITAHAPNANQVEPVIATGSATSIPPPPVPLGGPNPYELYCPGTPVGDIVLNGVSTLGTLSPPDPAPGQQFQLDGYQSVVPLPSSIVSAAAALGNVAINGNATATVDAAGATPATTPEGPLDFSVPIPTPVPSSGLTFAVPTKAMTVGPFTAASDTVTLTEDPSVSLSLIVSGSILNLTCTSYPDNSAPTGITSSRPVVSPIAPVIATSSAVTSTVPPVGGGTTTTTAPGPVTTPPQPGPSTPPAGPVSDTTSTTSGQTTTASEPASTGSTTTGPPGDSGTATTVVPTGASSSVPTAGGGSDPTTASSGRTTEAPGVAARSGVVSAPSSSLAFTGPGSGTGMMALVGLALVALGVLILSLVDAPRRLVRAIGRRTHRRAGASAADWSEGERPHPPANEGPAGLWTQPGSGGR